ncbi:MAG: MATE family efflux transporter [Gaiellaceae bacterium]
MAGGQLATQSRSMSRLLRPSQYDVPIIKLALPALGALAVEPLYVLVDTAIVGHLGATPLASLAIAGAVLSGLYGLFNFLAYGTTAQVGRADGAGARGRADSIAMQALWLAIAIGTALVVALIALAPAVDALMGGRGAVGHGAVLYLRISALGLPFALITLAGQGYLRGIADLRTPLVVLAGANALNVVLELIFVYGLHWGLKGSAWGTVIAQLLMGAAFVVLVVRKAGLEAPSPAAMRPLLSVGIHLMGRTAALLGSFVVAAAIVARFGKQPLGAHQIASELWGFLALVLDSIAIAGQVIVGRALGAGEADEAYAAARRMIVLSTWLGVALGMLLIATQPLLVSIFTGDHGVREQTRSIWLLLALMQPLAGAVFALDGILIGAGDTRYLMWAMAASAAVYVALASLALVEDWGLRGVWVGLTAFIAVRLATLLGRFSGRRWLVLGLSA